MRPRHDRGGALIVTLFATMLLSALGLALVLMTTAETLITANFRSAQETLYAAEAGLERGVHDLLRVSSWNAVLAGGIKSGFVDNGANVLPDGTAANLTALTNGLQRDSDAEHGSGPNRPVWRPFAHARVSDLLSTGSVSAHDYVVVWVADDPAETDGDPLTDTNGILMVRSEAFGERGGRKAIEATLSRRLAEMAEDSEDPTSGRDPSAVRMLTWREVR